MLNFKVSGSLRLVHRPKCGDYYRILLQIQFIPDDKSNFTLSHSTFTGNDLYYSNDRILTPDDVKHYEK